MVCLNFSELEGVGCCRKLLIRIPNSLHPVVRDLVPRRSQRMTRAGLHVEFRVDLEQKQAEMDNRNTCMKALAHSYESLVKVAIELASVKFKVRFQGSFEARRVMYYPMYNSVIKSRFFSLYAMLHPSISSFT